MTGFLPGTILVHTERKTVSHLLQYRYYNHTTIFLRFSPQNPQNKPLDHQPLTFKSLYTQARDPSYTTFVIADLAINDRHYLATCSLVASGAQKSSHNQEPRMKRASVMYKSRFGGWKGILFRVSITWSKRFGRKRLQLFDHLKVKISSRCTMQWHYRLVGLFPRRAEISERIEPLSRQVG